MLPAATIHIQIKTMKQHHSVKIHTKWSFNRLWRKKHTLREKSGEKCYTIKTSERA